MKIEHVRGLPELQATLRDFSDRRAASAVATALTRTAVQVKAEMRTVFGRTFDRPTPFTLNSLYAKPATAATLQARVYVKDDENDAHSPAAYLLPQVRGGRRAVKGLEYALQAAGALPRGWFITPGPGAALDAYGNWSRGQLVQVLSQLRIQLVAGTSRNMSHDARKQASAQKRAGGRFFVVKPGGAVRPGVYQREFIGRNVTPVVWFVQRSGYRQRLDFESEARTLAADILPREVERAVTEQLARLAAKRAGT